MAGAAPDRSRQAGPTSQSSQESAERPSFLGLDSKPEYSLEGLMLKLQYFGHLMQRTDSLEKTLMLGKIKGERRKVLQRMR